MAFTYSVLPTAETFIAFHSLFYTAFPIPGIRKDVCAALRPAFQGTEGRTGATAACLVPLHAGASTDVETTRYSALWGILLVVALMRSAFYPYQCLPGRPLFVPPGRCHFYRFHPHRFYSGNAVIPFYRSYCPCLRPPCRHRRRFCRCECRLPCLFPPF